MFATLIGNDEVKQALRQLLTGGRVPGSLLFTGEAGIGKKLFALELAKALGRMVRRITSNPDCWSKKYVSTRLSGSVSSTDQVAVPRTCSAPRATTCVYCGR